MSTQLRHTLTAFALATWVYRAVIFFGIAVAVYLMFFKVLGIFLFGVEVVWFILRPIRSEFFIWHKRWSEVKINRRLWLTGFGLGLLVFLATPWAFDIASPGVAHPQKQQNIFSPFPARLVELHAPGKVNGGTELVVFDAPDLQARQMRTTATIKALNQRLTGLVAEDGGIDQRRATGEKLSEQLAETQATRDEGDRLRVTAEFAGIWLDVDPTLVPGSWVGSKNQIGILVDPSVWVVDAYVEQRQVDRIQVGALARFRPEHQWRSINAKVIAIDSTRSSKLVYAMLDAHHGGPIATQSGEHQALPIETLYRVRVALAEPLADLHETRGHAIVEGSRKSLAWEAIKRVVAVVIRESGF